MYFCQQLIFAVFKKKVWLSKIIYGENYILQFLSNDRGENETPTNGKTKNK